VTGESRRNLRRIEKTEKPVDQVNHGVGRPA
jgi:hypothetical protein